MKFFRAAFTEKTLAKIKSELDSKMKENCWGISEYRWNKNIQYGNSTSCLFTYTSEELKKIIQEELRGKLPACEKIDSLFYIWQKGSSISEHEDPVYKFAATVYLNLSWEVHYGGVFLWKREGQYDYSSICPEYNMMVLNDSKEKHLVSNVSMSAPENRITLQIWGY